MNRINFWGFPVDNLSLEEALQQIEGFIRTGKPHQHVAINVDKIIKMRKDPQFRKTIAGCDLITIDGQPLIWVSRLLGQPIKERFGGLDIINGIIPRAADKGYRIYLLGAREEVVEKVVEYYKLKFSSLKIAGWHNGYWEARKEEKIVTEIRNVKPDILFVAVSSPKKEVFLQKYLRKMDVPFVMGVGGAFDIIAGVTKRAPKWMQRCSLEWLFRLYQEPLRLWKRYLIEDPIFVWLVLKELVKVRVLGRSK